MHGITFAVGREIGRYNVVDVTWGLGFVGGRRGRRGVGTATPSAGLLLLFLVAVWGFGWPGT
jgi:steroid 5-alpha reductase family enzyme